MLPAGMRDRTKVHFCGPTGANAVDAAIKLCKTATGRGDVIAFQGGFHGTTHLGMALTGLVANKAPVAQRGAGRALLPVLPLRRLPARATRAHLRDQLRRTPGARRCGTRTAGYRGRRR